MNMRVVLVLIAVVLLFGDIDAMHFRGGIITYKPSTSAPNTIEFFVRLSFRRSKVYCDNSLIASKQLISTFQESWRLIKHGTWQRDGGPLKIHCTSFNVDEDWIEGYNNFSTTQSQNENSYEFRVYGGNWITALNSPYSHDTVDLVTKFNLTARSNNSSPISKMPLTIYVAKGFPSIFSIPVHDPDGDIVRCRNASFQECNHGICTYWPYGKIDEKSCSISYDGGGSEGQLFPIHLFLEDYAHGTLEFEPSNRFGSVDLQFIVRISNVSSSATINPSPSSSPTSSSSYATMAASSAATGCQKPCLYVSNTTHILSVSSSLDQNSITAVVFNLSRAVALDVHVSGEMIFWSDLGDITINRANTNGTDIQVIVKDRMGVCDGLAVEWSTGLLYWTDTTFNKIEVAHLDGSRRHVLISDKLDEPRGIAVDPLTGVMFWTDWGANPKIECAHLNGENRQAIINSSLRWPNDIALDRTSKKIYWVDASTDKIETADYSGNNRKQLLYYSGIHPFGLAIFSEWLYWTDWSTVQGLHQMNKKTGNLTNSIHISSYRNRMGVAVFDNSNQPSVSNGCQYNNGGCSFLCLLKPNGYTCVCPKATTLGMDGKTCVNKTQGCGMECLNGGTCRTGYSGDYCSCPSGYSGRYCEAKFGCHNDTCLNGGTCRNSYYGSGYYCSCPYGHSGNRCETKFGCARYNHTCFNGGTCFGYHCSCPLGYTGGQCETAYGCARDNSTCLNGGTCRTTYYGYYCSCPNEYSGRYCETKFGCHNVTCLNGGTCRNTYYGSGYYCNCPYGHSGKHCESAIGECVSSPCRNGGTCRSTYYGYSCSCPYPFIGNQCEENSACMRSGYPCRNGGTCHGSYCRCPSGYGGRQCETNLRMSVSCEDHYMEINLTRSYYRDVDWRNLHLNNKSCRALAVTWDTITLRTRFDDCGTTYKEDNDTIVFGNEVAEDQRYKSGNVNSITRVHLIVIRFHCKYSRRKLVSTSFSPSKKLIYASEGSFGNFTFTMELYRSASYRTQYSLFDYPVPVALDEPLWIQFQVKKSIGDLVVFAESCRATTSVDPNSFPQYKFLVEGCVRDPTMVYNYNQYSSVQRFSIKSFRFVYSTSQLVYLHCELLVCHRNSANSRCSRGCINSRRRREATTDDDDSSGKYDLSAGPFKQQSSASKNDAQINNVTIGTSAGLGVVGGILLVVCGVLLFKKLRKLCFPSLLKRAYVAPSPSVPMEASANSYQANGLDLDYEKKAEIDI